MSERALDLLLDDNDELVIVNGDWAMATDKIGIKQLIKIKLRFFQGEWFLDLEAGIAFWTAIFIKNPSLVEVREIFRQALSDTPGVSNVITLDVQYTAARVITVVWQVQTDLGLLISGQTASENQA